jgi:hypothetical protein
VSASSDLALDRVGATTLEAPSPDAQALVPWSVELTEGQIMVAGTAIHPILARDLWMRLGALLGEAERDGEQAEWSRLAGELDRHFRGCPPAQGRTLDRPSMPVGGLVLQEHEDLVAFRMATYSIAVLKKTKRGWEGPVYALRPTAVGHERRPLGTRVRVAAEAIGPVRRLQLPGPAATLPPRPVKPNARPEVPEWLRARWTDIRVVHAAILALVPNVGDAGGFELFAASLRIPRDELRGHLDTLREQGELVETKPKAAGEIVTWRRAARPAFDAPRKGRGTRVGTAKPARKPAKPATTPKRKAKPAPPAPATLLRCAPCDRMVRVPAGTPVPELPRCATCGGLLVRWSS